MVVQRVLYRQPAVTSITLACLIHAVLATPTANSPHNLTINSLAGNVLTVHSPAAFMEHFDSQMPINWLQPEMICSPAELMNDHFSRYTAFPLSVITFNLVNACQNLQENREVVVLEDRHQLSPEWLAHATVLGECPWELVRKDFIPGIVPPSIIELGCLCNDHRCSLVGNFKCIPVSRSVRIWNRGPHSCGSYHPQTVKVTVACVCAQPHSPRGGEAQPFLWN
ncbi:uncharacterized protein LOC121854108 [Homarus americanus]|uniref:Putative Interleukin-17-containing protein n=1 Tax=Homarus americanus TaxID=6706 RepID=A0A8J5JCZ3_HOMAM|nr:uncharacterized protein LOC121854108 [Homarus americanus]KAG7156132.1 putative Interleukin-17-containing protein [Homarus americanus]